MLGVAVSQLDILEEPKDLSIDNPKLVLNRLVKDQMVNVSVQLLVDVSEDLDAIVVNVP